MNNKYGVLIGLEMHCEISTTKTKAFSGAKNSFSSLPNENVVAIDMAMPGTLPLINKEAVRKALKASIILNCKTPDYLCFERKNYYYPDLPKGYQITQETKPYPVGSFGYFEYYVEDTLKKVNINNIHLEEDTANLDHYDDYSLIDYNRAGVPLLELVTEPEFYNADEAVAFLEAMKKIYQFTDISEADSKKGHVRCDVNISIMDKDLDRSNPDNWGTKIEIKNVNSIQSVRDAIDYEVARQIEEIENNTFNEMDQHTRRWDENLAKTVFMRSKKDAIDYKYFVEPNIPKYKLTEEFISKIKEEIPVLPIKRYENYINIHNISKIDAISILKDKDISDYLDECISIGINPITATNWILSSIIGYLNKSNISIKELYLKPSLLKIIIDNIENNTISSKQAKDIFNKSLEENISPDELIDKNNTQLNDEDELDNIIKNIMNNSSKQIEEYKNGRTNLFQYFVGQVMKETKGSANPVKTKELIEKYLK